MPDGRRHAHSQVIGLRQTAAQNAAQRAAGIAAYDAKVDVWALGVLAFELLFGRELFGGTADIDALTTQICHSTLAFPDRGYISEDAISFIRARARRSARAQPPQLRRR